MVDMNKRSENIIAAFGVVAIILGVGFCVWLVYDNMISPPHKACAACDSVYAGKTNMGWHKCENGIMASYMRDSYYTGYDEDGFWDTFPIEAHYVCDTYGDDP